MTKKIGLAVAALFAVVVAIVLVLAAAKPDHLHVERSLLIEATAEEVFPYANDFRLFTSWIPWTELDPAQQMDYSEPSSGVGAWYTWKGNDDVGQGRMEILSSEPLRVVHELEFIEPFETHAQSSVTIEAASDPAAAGKVRVSWAYDEDVGFGSKLMQVFVDMDIMLGADFEKGLANLSAKIASARATKPGEG